MNNRMKLNKRQKAMLALLESREAFKISDLLKLKKSVFADVSRMTLTRDLDDLIRKQLVKRVGAIRQIC